MRQILRLVRREDQHPDPGARRRGQAGGKQLLRRVLVHLAVQQLLHLLGGHARHRRRGVDQPLVHHVHGNLHRRRRRPLARAGLEQEEPAALDGELDVLHVLVGILQLFRQPAKLPVDIGHGALQLAYGHGGADARHDVLALSVDEELAVQLVLAVGRVSGEADARAAVFAQVAEDHGYDVDRRPQVVGNPVDLPVGHGARDVPAPEHGLDGPAKLLPRVGREVPPRRLLIDLPVLGDQLLQRLSRDLEVLGDPEPIPAGRERGLEAVGVHLVHDVAEHLDETAVAVEGEAPVAGYGGQPLDGLVVQSQVQYRLHHPRHGDGRTGAHRNQKRVFPVSEALARLLLQRLDGLFDPIPDRIHDPGVLHVPAADLRREDEPGRDGKPALHHLAEVGSLAPQEQLLVALALLQVVDELLRHVTPLLILKVRPSGPHDLRQRKSGTNSLSLGLQGSRRRASLQGLPARLVFILPRRRTNRKPPRIARSHGAAFKDHRLGETGAPPARGNPHGRRRAPDRGMKRRRPGLT